MASGTGTPYFPTGYQSGYASAQSQELPPKPESPKPPKKPLTPYMRFSTSIWQQVKAANPGFSICEIGSTIGRMWRELADEEKQRHMEDFNKDKIRYDNELQNYLKSQGLRSLKAKTKKKPEPRPVSSSLPAAQPRRDANVASATTMQPPPAHTSQAVTQHQQLAQAFMGLPIAGMSGGIPMAVGMPPGMMGMLPHFSQQVWTGQQYVGGQQMMQLQLAAQQQQQSSGSAVGTAQELYANGYQDVAATTSAAAKQMASTRDRPSGTDFRYSQNYN